MSENVLEIKHLRTSFFTNGKEVRASDDLSYSVKKGECVAIIGESGSGKSVSALSILQLIPYPPGLVLSGQVIYEGKNLLECSASELEEIRGAKISMIFQEASAALNPVITIGKQIREALLNHNPGMTRKDADKRAVELLEMVGIPNAERRVKQYPFEFSGGMQQRAMIAMAMSCEPDILIADEPTTALDVTVQAQVLEQLNRLREEHNMALILITHNLGVVARYADSVKIMYGGSIVEEGSAIDIFKDPHHPYTIGLIRAVPRLDKPKSWGLREIQGESPDMSKIKPNTCAFYDRCEYRSDECLLSRPGLEHVGGEYGEHFCACHHKDEVKENRGDLS